MDPDRYPNGTHRNKLGLTDPHELAEAEVLYVQLRQAELVQRGGWGGSFDRDHLTGLHHYLFQDVYEWAGQVRGETVTVDGQRFTLSPFLAKEGPPFALGPQVAPRLEALFATLETERGLRGLEREVFAARAAQHFAELNAIHPFLEGNGRVQRQFFSELAVQAGHGLDFSIISQERMVRDSLSAHLGDLSGMTHLFREVSSEREVGRLAGVIALLEKNDVNWNELYLSTARAGETYRGVVAAHSSENVVLMAGDAVIVVQRRDAPEEKVVSGATLEITATRSSGEPETGRGLGR